MLVPDPILPVALSRGREDQHADLRKAAGELEAVFLAEMLKSAKFGEPRGNFGGGAGEAQFASFLRAEVAKDLAKTGGLGLAEHVFEALKERAGEKRS